MAKIWCTSKGLSVPETGQYLVSGVHTAPDGPVSALKIFPEAASILGAWSTRRVLTVTQRATLSALAGNENEAGGKLLLSDILSSNGASQSESDYPLGPLIIAVKPSLNDQHAAVGHILGQLDADGFVSLVDESILG